MFVVNVCKLNKTNDVGPLRLIVCSKYPTDKSSGFNSKSSSGWLEHEQSNIYRKGEEGK